MFNWNKKSKFDQWEYTMLPITTDEDGEGTKPWEYLEMLNSLGTTGWELVAVLPTCFIFKKKRNA